MFRLMDGRENTWEDEGVAGLIPNPELERSVDRRLRDGIEIGLERVGVEQHREGTEETRLRGRGLLDTVSSPVVSSSSEVKRTSTLRTLRRPWPMMGGTTFCTGFRNRSDPMVGMATPPSRGCGSSSLSYTLTSSSITVPTACTTQHTHHIMSQLPH